MPAINLHTSAALFVQSCNSALLSTINHLHTPIAVSVRLRSCTTALLSTVPAINPHASAALFARSLDKNGASIRLISTIQQISWMVTRGYAYHIFLSVKDLYLISISINTYSKNINV
jgi:hypothetical protein